MPTVVGWSTLFPCLPFSFSEFCLGLGFVCFRQNPKSPQLALNSLSSWKWPWVSDPPPCWDNRCLGPYPVFKVHVESTDLVRFSVCAEYVHTSFSANVLSPLRLPGSLRILERVVKTQSYLEASHMDTFAQFHWSSYWVLCAGLFHASGIVGRVPGACAEVWKLNFWKKKRKPWAAEYEALVQNRN